MKRRVSKESIKEYIKRLDTRCKKYDDAKFDDIIDDAFSEFNTIGSFFDDEDTVDVRPYLENGIKKITYDVEKDVTYIYDAFLSEDAKKPHQNSDNMVEVDPRVQGRINVDFTSEEDMYGDYSYHPQDDIVVVESINFLVVRYFYVPDSDFEYIYMDRDVYKAFRQAIASTVYLDLHDDAKSAMHLQRMKMYGDAIIVQRPFDFDEPTRLKRFIDGC